MDGGRGWSVFATADSSSNVVSEKQSELEQNYGEGHFYRFWDYVQLLEPEADFSGWDLRDYMSYMQTNYPDTPVVLDRNNVPGVKQSLLPQGAAYKYKECFHHEVQTKHART